MKRCRDMRWWSGMAATAAGISLIILAGCLFPTSPAAASGLANAKAIAMAGAYTSLAKGYYSPSFNPANLGLPANRMTGMQLFGLGVSVKNNSFSLDDYNTYTGARLDEGDKQELLDKIPSEGLKLSADAEATAFGLGLGSVVASISMMGAAEINLGRTPVELMLNGNTFAETIDLDGIYGQGYAIGSFNLSYGHLLYKNVDRQLAIGGTFKYLKGYGYEEITEANGEAVTLSTGFEGAGNLVARTSSGGSGYACDIGAALQLNRNYTIGVTVFNFFSAMRWSEETEEHRYTFEFDTVTLAIMTEDSLFTSTDTTIATEAFTTSLPTVIRVGLAKTSGSLRWALDWEQGFEKAAGSSKTPRVAAGGEYSLLSFLPIRAGFGLGGKQGTTFAGGFGVNVSVAHLDIGVANYNAVVGSGGKGINFAVNGGFRF